MTERKKEKIYREEKIKQLSARLDEIFFFVVILGITKKHSRIFKKSIPK